MNGSNGQFISAPEIFLSTNIVNNVRWLQKAGLPTASASERGLISMADTLKEASFDLIRKETADGKMVYDFTISNQVVNFDQPIPGYWCPFVQGVTMPGYVDIPRNNPQHNFVFTPAMNGCALVVMESPKGSGWMRVYHHQHPGNRSINDMIKADSKGELLSYLVFEDYGTDAHPNAFNFLYYRNASWIFISQPQSFNLATREILLRPHSSVLTQSTL